MLSAESFEGIKSDFKKIMESAKVFAGNAVEVGQFIMDFFRNSPQYVYDVDSATIVSKTLHRMKEGIAPRIALSGITSSGKSTLMNALFGASITETKRTRDTTNCVLKAEFPSGLVIYDTPGILSDEQLENITRAFLELDQVEKPKVDWVPFQRGPTSAVEHIPIDKIREEAPFDIVLFVVNASSVPGRGDRRDLRLFFLELERKFPGRVIIVGTHIDELTESDEKEKILEDWTDVFQGQMLPVSSIKGDGLDDLVLLLFRNISGDVSLTKLQESLNTVRKLDRISFVLTEASSILAEISLLKGNQAEDIKISSLMLFAIICNHYSADEETWLKYNGDAVKIGEEVKKTGITTDSKKRSPKGLWERLRSLFGKEFFKEVVEYHKLGVRGIAELLPKIYWLIYDFENTATDKAVSLGNAAISQKVSSSTTLESLIEKGDVKEIANEIERLLRDILVP